MDDLNSTAEAVITASSQVAVPITDALARSLVAGFDAVAARLGTKAAVVDGGIRLTFDDVRVASLILAEELSCLPNGPIGALLEHEATFVVVALAARRTGRPFVVLDARHPEERLSSVGKAAGLSAIVCDALNLAPGALPGIPRLEFPTCREDAEVSAPSSALSEEPAFITFTSGSTGEPKGICNSEDAILHRIDQLTASLEWSGHEVVALATSPGTIAGLRDALGSLLAGATLVAAQPSRLGIGGMLETIAAQEVTFAYMVPALLRSAVRHPLARERLASLRRLRVGGDVLWESDLAEARAILPQSCRILYNYSSTECPTVFHFLVPPKWRGNGEKVPLGFPQPGFAIDLVGENGEPVPVGCEGELVVRGRSVALGLWRSGRLDASASPTDAEGMRTLNTGDLLRVDSDGIYHAVGRKCRMVKVRGLRADPGEVEAALKAVNGVAEAAAVVRLREREAVGFDAVVVARPGTFLDPVIVLAAIAARLMPHMRPRTLTVVPAIPLLQGFKVDLVAVAAQVEAARTSRQNMRKDVHPAVAEAWATVLGRASLRRDDPFDEAGGDSLAAMDLLMLVERASGVRLPVDAIPAAVRPSELSALLTEGLVSRPAQSELEDEMRPIVAMFPGIGGDEPAFAALRTALGPRIRVVPVAYQGAASLLASGGTLQSVAAGAIADIQKECSPGAALHLLGYSYGGFVAWEAARTLRARGMPIASVILLDAGLGLGGSPPSARGKLRSRIRWAVWRIVAQVVELASAHQLHKLALLGRRVPGRIGTAMSRVVLKEAQRRTLRGDTRDFLDIPVLLLRSDQRPDLGNLGWDTLTFTMTIARVAGDHFTMLAGTALSSCVTQIQAFLGVA